MSDIAIQSLVNIVPVAALVLGLYYFLTKQMNAIEDRMREDRRESENRLRAEIKVVAESVETAKSELRAEIVASEDRLRSEIRELARLMEKGDSELAESVETAKSELRGEIAAVAQSVETAKSELRGEIAAVAQSVETAKSELGHRMDRTDDKISQLIQDVGVVQGAVLGIPTRAGSREPEPTATS